MSDKKKLRVIGSSGDGREKKALESLLVASAILGPYGHMPSYPQLAPPKQHYDTRVKPCPTCDKKVFADEIIKHKEYRCQTCKTVILD